MQGKEKALGATAETIVDQVCEAVHLTESVFLFFVLHSAQKCWNSSATRFWRTTYPHWELLYHDKNWEREGKSVVDVFTLCTSQQSQLQLLRAHRKGCGNHQHLSSCIQPQSPSRGHLRCWCAGWPLSEVKRQQQQWYRNAHATLAWVKRLGEEKKSLLSSRRGRQES